MADYYYDDDKVDEMLAWFTDNPETLNNWETQFIDDIIKVWKIDGTLSENRYKKLEQIYNERYYNE